MKNIDVVFIQTVFEHSAAFSNVDSAILAMNEIKKYYNSSSDNIVEAQYTLYEFASEYLYNKIVRISDERFYDADLLQILRKILLNVYETEKDLLPHELRMKIQTILGEENSHKKNQFPLKCTLIPCSVCSESVRNYIKFLYDDRTGNYYMIKIIDWAKKEVTIDMSTDAAFINTITLDMNKENLYFACYNRGGN